MSRYTKSDVEHHRMGYGGTAYPAVNVKVYNTPWDRLRAAAPHEFPGMTREWIESEVADETLDRIFWDACELAFEHATGPADEILGRHVTCSQEGRSGGWLVVSGLAPIETWDAVALARWRSFERHARAQADDVPYLILDLIYHNLYLPQLEEHANERASASDQGGPSGR